MRLALTSLALVALAPAATAQDQAPYPALEMLDAFRTGCGAIEDQAAASASAKAAGWSVAEPEAHPPVLAEFLDFAVTAGSAAVEAGGGTMSEMEVFENTVAGEKVYLVLSEVRIDGIRVSGCRLFDLGETRAIDTATAADWIGREPTRTVDQAGIVVADWEPGTMPSHDSFQLFFVSQDSPAKAALKFDGVAMKSDTVGVTQ